MQDIVPKKSIREVTKPHVPGVMTHHSHHTSVEQKKVVRETRDVFEEYPHARFQPLHKEKSRGWFVVVFLLMCVCGVGAFLHLQKSATIYITTTEESLTFKDTEIRIPINELAILTATTTSSIDIITSTGTPTRTKAKGTVTIYNANSTEQVLVVNTRLETPDGKIYRLDGTITIPKATLVGGKTTPGSVQALVTADKFGESHNISQSDFAFPGLLGSPRYKNVYARTKGSIDGGSETSTKIINEKDKNEKIEILSKEKTPSLDTQLRAQKSDDSFIIKSPMLTTAFEKISDTKGSVALTYSMAIVDAKKFATILTKSQKQNNLGSMEFVQNDLSIEYLSLDKTGAQIKVSGTAYVRAHIDQVALKTLLAGKPFNEFRELITQFEGIKESRFTSRPFWMTTFPQASRIFIEQK